MNSILKLSVYSYCVVALSIIGFPSPAESLDVRDSVKADATDNPSIRTGRVKADWKDAKDDLISREFDNLRRLMALRGMQRYQSPYADHPNFVLNKKRDYDYDFGPEDFERIKEYLPISDNDIGLKTKASSADPARDPAKPGTRKEEGSPKKLREKRSADSGPDVDSYDKLDNPDPAGDARNGNSQGKRSSVPGSSFPREFCNLEVDAGIMCPDLTRNLRIGQFHYDTSSNRCLNFAYNGCGGNANRFSSLWECTQMCVLEP